MKIFILIVSIIAIILSAFWAYSTGFSYEPVTVLLFGIAGLSYNFFYSKINTDISLPAQQKVPVNEQSNTQNQNVTLNINTDVKKGVESSKNLTAEREALIDSKKLKTNILFIDDDKKFNIVKILKDSGWKKTKTVVDLKSIDTPQVKLIDIFFVDINGVGKILELPHEGLDLAFMLKTRYPEKKVIIYSSDPKNQIFHEAWDLVDHKLAKNALPLQFQSLVEKFSLEL